MAHRASDPGIPGLQVVVEHLKPDGSGIAHRPKTPGDSPERKMTVAWQ